MTDPSLFVSGTLFTHDYLVAGITETSEFAAVDTGAVRATLCEILVGFPHDSKPNEATTESDFIWPVLRALGWADYLTQQNLSASGRVDVPDALLFINEAAKQRANGHGEEWKRYQFGAAIVESKRWGRALDRAEGRGERDTPSTQLLRYLRRIDDLTAGELRWGILTNGARWRLYFAGARSTIDDYLELDLTRIMELGGDLLDTGISDDERDHWLAVFVAMFSRAAFDRTGADKRSFHDRARSDAAFYEERVAKSLSDLVFDRLYPALGRAIANAAPAHTPLGEVRQATLILLYRLLFVLYAEDRGLLPVKDQRYDDYALRERRMEIGRRKDSGDSFSTVAKTIWHNFGDLAEMIDKGDPSVGLPPYNGGLFSSEQTPLLKAIALGDDVMAEAIDILSWERRDGQRRYINYRDLSVQQLGSIYERLLEFELTRGDAGDVDIRPNIFARKSSGSYYTPDDLVLLILDETLEPLIADALAAFTDALDKLRRQDSEDFRIAQLQKVDPAKAITRLRICDPAMGSGHFLVSLVDRLTNHALNAMAEAAALARAPGIDLDYESPVAEEIRKIRATIRHNAEDARWAVSEDQLDDPQLVKRMVLKRCIYGVDKNPMAVELAKVSLWLHTFTVGAPLSFIDHHLAAGDSLFGLWVRDAIDRAAKGGELFYADALRNAQRQAVAMRTIEALTDAEIAEAHRSAEMWTDVEAQTGPLDSFVSFMHALDWLNLPRTDRALVNLWLDGQFGDPVSLARGRIAPEAGKARPDEVERFTQIWCAARDLISEERFLNWQITFPGVWENWASAAREGGFDAVVGNPPWDRIKLQQVEWFAARRPEIARAQRASDRSRMIRALEEAGDPLYADYQKADRRAGDAARVARGSGHYPLLSRGDINLYSLFVERAHALVRPGGMVGLLTPSGIASDLSASAFFRKVATGGHLKTLYDFENKKVFFPDVHASFKFCIFVASPARTFSAAICSFYLHSIEELKNPDQVFPITATDFARVNPNTGTAPIFRTRRDMALTTAIYERLPVLVDRSGDEPVAAWPVRYVRMFDMTNDSHLFRTQAELEEKEGAWPVGGNRWKSEAGEWVPLYVGRMLHLFDHRAASVSVNEANLHNPALSVEVTPEMKADPAYFPTPQYWVASTTDAPSKPAIAFRDIARATDVRTFIASFIPSGSAGNTAPLLVSDLPFVDQALMLGNINSTVLDYVARQKAQSTHLNWYIVEQLPIIPPAGYGRAFGAKTASEIVRQTVLELTYTAHDMAPFARDMGHVDAAGNVLPPFVWDEERRLHLRAKLDALYFILYGVYDPADPAASRDDIRYIYSTFPIVERQEIAAWGCYRSRDLCLAYLNALIAGQPDAEVTG
ncbi:Eco57I restriction-modification methylase domain-containing protein [Sphingosinicella microcystinivorans]|uniref:Eco57I restriction-modification methylase domain-containing protein n=1 Tax=Sphingosinicella microcystinivorans TaxID=335406 RepID=UPI0022F3A67E|nr:hypothetical protein [Sphingosinicella microcystinivorans]WBX86236.1 hypothetical protein PE061_10135 [Sphingosinicella microcystinivorans]